jgi:hypothetical protein
VAERSVGSAALGLVLGFLASRTQFLGWATLLPWAAGALLVGAVSRDWRQGLALGAAYGFVLGFSFAAFVYAGADPILGKAPFFAVLGAVSAGFGATLSVAGQRISTRVRPRSGAG